MPSSVIPPQPCWGRSSRRISCHRQRRRSCQFDSEVRWAPSGCRGGWADGVGFGHGAVDEVVGDDLLGAGVGAEGVHTVSAGVDGQQSRALTELLFNSSPPRSGVTGSRRCCAMRMFVGRKWWALAEVSCLHRWRAAPRTMPALACHFLRNGVVERAERRQSEGSPVDPVDRGHNYPAIHARPPRCAARKRSTAW